ncbi:hypothetical protein OIU74_028469 [Salix koriyanagi]|uniref:Uncharacterized protein n=1 Tax=Salix koriyanagi TaxID=2511006 RepID=A0A9Q0VDU5_9ROSI|nr:hypothetical protein OIU74_028469 [Salix koriyanagi]
MFFKEVFGNGKKGVREEKVNDGYIASVIVRVVIWDLGSGLGFRGFRVWRQEVMAVTMEGGSEERGRRARVLVPAAAGGIAIAAAEMNLRFSVPHCTINRNSIIIILLFF